jgi:hypothetical protein
VKEQPQLQDRGYSGVAALLESNSPALLIGMARHVDPELDEDDILMVGRMPDRMPDWAFAECGVSTPEAVAVLRNRFAAWPR